jgi:hypothetical protein
VVSRKRRDDLREFWPWYERSVNLPPGAGYTTPPPFTLGDVGKKEPPAGRRTGRSLHLLWLAAGVGLLAFLLWGFLH